MPKSARFSLIAVFAASALALLLFVAFAPLPGLAMVEQGVSISDLVTHTVGHGDTLRALARRYGVSVEEIVAANTDIGVLPLYRGDRIIVPVLAKAEPVAAPRTAVTIPEGITGIVYRVGRGDNLSRIAERLGVSVEAIMAANGLSERQLYFGQRLLIPAAEKAVEAKTSDAQSSSESPRLLVGPEEAAEEETAAHAAAVVATELPAAEVVTAPVVAPPAAPVTVEAPATEVVTVTEIVTEVVTEVVTEIEVVTVTERVPVTVVETVTVTKLAPPATPVRVEIPVTEVVTVTERVPVTVVEKVFLTQSVPITVIERVTVTEQAPPARPIRVEVPVTQTVTVTESVPVTVVETVTRVETVTVTQEAAPVVNNRRAAETWEAPEARVALFAPVSGGAYHSPIPVVGLQRPFMGTLEVYLTGPDGRILARRSGSGMSGGDVHDFRNVDLRFTVAETTPATATVAAVDAVSGMRMQEETVPVILLPGQRALEIYRPAPGAAVCAPLIVAGQASTPAGGLTLELRAADGETLEAARAQTGVGGTYRDFATAFDYAPEVPTPVLLVAYAAHPTDADSSIDYTATPLTLYPADSLFCQ